MFRHSKLEPDEYGHSPGNGMTEMRLSDDLLATEGEATPGPDHVNPYEQEDADFEEFEPEERDDEFEPAIGLGSFEPEFPDDRDRDGPELPIW